MELRTNFFTKLRKLAVTMETETARLKVAFENNKSDDDSETAVKAKRAYHELNSDLRNVKAQVQQQLAQQSARGDALRSFMDACTVMEKRAGQDIQELREHWEKYGYQHSHRATKVKGHGQEPEDEAENGNEAKSSGGEEGSLGEEENPAPVSPPPVGPPPDPLRTPQLSDFGLSEMQLKRMLGKNRCPEPAPMPEIRPPEPLSLSVPTPPHVSVTPRRTLQMEEEELQMPQMSSFGITEPTLCLDDFTMNLPRKKLKTTDRPQEPEAAVSSHSRGPGGPPALGEGLPGSPAHPGRLPVTPEVPAFQTPYMNRLLSCRKGGTQPEPMSTEDQDEICTFDLTTPCHRAVGSEEHKVPPVIGGDVEDKQVPQMPVLESTLGKHLQRPEEEEEEVPVHRLDQDGATQEFSLRTPHTRGGGYRELSTPEMPELSSVTLDICKLVSQAQAQLKKSSGTVTQLHFTPEKDGSMKPSDSRAASLPLVSEGEFQSLPDYLRQITLQGLNRAVQSINTFTAERHGEQTEFQMEELQRITKAKMPMCVLCLIELKRLKRLRGVGKSSTFKLITHA
ncbi:SKA complex subunit 3 [Genypterus blacodes]|uniref:SKA complex subunit 3 n=1 Tax=Genypterus blacodes TaxID=154954 RepID=UPI003F7582C6